MLAAALTTHVSAQTTASTSSGESDGNIIELSPFEVDASNDAGYYSERTLAGSRIDMKLSDIAASISVINREQLEDTSATDINDVFLYDINSEGSATYTETITSFRDGLRDSGSGFSAANTGSFSGNATANRLRGLGTPDNSRNYYRAIANMGFDSYNTRSVEINRGPNSLLFGQGSPAGIVNQNTADASASRRETELQFRLGDHGSYRAHVNHNEPVIEDVLGFYVAGLYDKEGFRRKPSYDVQKRAYAAISFRPIEKLRIRGSYETFRQSQSRPNTLTPIDAVTPWLEAGRPVYNPVTRMVTIQDTGAVVGPYFQNAASVHATAGVPAGNNGLNSVSSPFYVPGINLVGGNTITMIDSRDNYFTVDTTAQGTNKPTFVGFVDLPPAAAARTPEQWAIFDQNWSRSATELTLRSNRGPDGFRVSNWQPRTVTDRSIYDWTRYNTNSPNYADFEGNTKNVEIDFPILDNWVVQLGYFDQSFEAAEHFTLGQLNANRLWVDTNTHLINGDPNPFVGQPFVEDSQPDTFLRSIDNSTLRAQTALSLDFTDRDDIFRWLGRQNIVAIGTRADWDTSQIRTRGTTVAGHPAYLPERDLATNTYWQRGQRLVRQYYMGSPGTQGQVTRSAPQFGQPSFGGPNTTTNLRYNWGSGAYQTVENEWANALSEAGSTINKETTESVTVSWNASLLDNRLVPVVGYRRDTIRSRQTTGTQGLAAADWIEDGYPVLDVLWANYNEQKSSGTTWTYGATFDVFRNEKHEFSIFYNQSENFNPQAGVNVDFEGNRLKDPGGEGKDYGFSFGMWNNKLTLRVTRFEALSTGDTTGPAGGAIDRLGRIDRDYFFPWAETIARIEAGQLDAFIDPERDPYEEIDLESSTAIQNRIQELTGLPYDYYANIPGTLAATQTNKAEGTEVSVTWNPNGNWTFRAALSSQETAFSEVGPEVDAWLEKRSARWDGATSPLPAGQNSWLFNGTREANLTNFWGSYGYNANAEIDHPQGWDTVRDFYELAVAGNINLYKAQQGRPVDNQRKYRANLIGKYTFTEGPLKSSFIGGALRYESKVAIGYYGLVGDPAAAPDLINVADLDRPIYDKANTYFDVWFGYRTRLFDDKARVLVQLNVRNLFESGDLRPVGADFAGTKHTWRIIEPREMFLTTTLQF
jgi:outer membrane receptor protein involved in Fe transport